MIGPRPGRTGRPAQESAGTDWTGSESHAEGSVDDGFGGHAGLVVRVGGRESGAGRRHRLARVRQGPGARRRGALPPGAVLTPLRLLRGAGVLLDVRPER